MRDGRLMRSIAKGDRQVPLDIISRHRRIPAAIHLYRHGTLPCDHKTRCEKRAIGNFIVTQMRKREREREKLLTSVTVYSYRVIFYA